MWWLFVAVIVASAEAIVPNTDTSVHGKYEAATHVSKYTPDELSAVLDELSNKYLHSLEAANSHIGGRQKRAVSTQRISLAGDTGAYKLQAVKPLLQLCSPAVKVEYLDLNNQTYMVCITAPTAEGYSIAYLGLISVSEIRILAHWYIRAPKDSAIFADNDNIYVLVADEKNADGVDLRKYDTKNEKMTVVYTVHCMFPTSVAVWKMQVYGTYHLAVANSAGDSDGNQTTEIYFYNWLDTYFDMYSSVVAYNVKDIEPFHIHGSAYIAVANFGNGNGYLRVDSEIFRYNLDAKSWVSLQRITTYGAMDWEFFTLGKGSSEEYFLGIAGYDTSVADRRSCVIYKFVEDIFVPFQCLKTPPATSITVMNTEGTFLLAVASTDGVLLFQYDGWRFVLAPVQHAYNVMGAGANALTFHTFEGEKQTYTLSVANIHFLYERTHSMFELAFTYRNDLHQWHKKAMEWCMNKQGSIGGSDIESTIGRLQNVYYVDQKNPIVLAGNVNFDDGLKSDVVVTPELKDRSGKVYNSDVINDLKRLSGAIEGIRVRIDHLKNVLSKAVRLEANQFINASYDFKDVTFACSSPQSCNFGRISTTILNGKDVQNMRENIILLNEENLVSKPVYVEHIRAPHVDIRGLVNDRSVGDFVTRSGTHHITATKIFINTINTNHIVVSAKLNNMHISPETILLRHGVQSVTGSASIDNAETSWLHMKYLNGINFESFLNDLVLLNGSYEIVGQKVFQDVAVGDLQLIRGSSINGIDLVDFWNNALWISGDQEITAPLTFSTVAFEKNLSVKDINGLQLPGPRILFTNQNAQILKRQIFQNEVFISELHVTESVNEVGVSDTGELDLLLKKRDQVVQGRKTFDRIMLHSPSHVEGTVNGIDLSEFQANVFHRGSVLQSNNTWVFNNVVVKGPLQVNTLSGHKLQDVYSNAVKLADNINHLNFVFKGEVKVDDLHVVKVNDIDISRDLVQVNKTQEITGVKTFTDVIIEDEIYLTGFFNNRNLSFLQDSLLRIGNQRIYATKYFTGDVRASNLIVHGFINGVDVKDIATRHDPIEISAAKTLTNATFNKLVVGKLETRGLVNGVDIPSLVENTMTYDGFQIVTGPLTIYGTLHVPNESNLDTKSLNGVDIGLFLKDAVLVDTPQNITGRKVFTNMVTFDDLWVQSIDGIAIEDMKNNWLRNGVDKVISGDITVGNMNVKSATAYGYVNGYNLTELNSQILKTNEDVTHSGLSFDTVISLGDITLTGKVQNVDLSEEAVSKSATNVISGEKIFQAVTINGNLDVKSSPLANVVKAVCQSAIYLDKNEHLGNLTVKGDVIFNDDIFVGGTIAGVDITALYNSAVKSLNDEVYIEGYKEFQNLTIDGVLTVKGKVGGEDIEELNRNYMSLTRQQVIQAPFTFKQLNVEGIAEVRNMYTRNNKINGIDLTELNDTVLKTKGFQQVAAELHFDELLFEDDLFVAGKVNGMEIPKGLMRRNKTNYVKKAKTFLHNVIVLGDLGMESGSKVQGIPLAEWYKTVINKNYGKYEIEGFKTFQDITANDVTVKGNIDGVTISEDSLLLSYGTQIVAGQKTFKNSVSMENLMAHSLINGINLTDAMARVVMHNRNDVITEMKTFKEPLVVNKLTADYIDGVNILDLQEAVNDHLDAVPIQNRLAETDVLISEMSRVSKSQAVVLQYYELLQTFPTPGAYKWLYVPTSNTEYLMISDFTILPDGCTSVNMLQYNPRYNVFELSNQSISSSFSPVLKYIEAGESVFLIVANQPNDKCLMFNVENVYSKAWSTIYTYDKSNKYFEPYQNITTSATMDLATLVHGDTICLIYVEIYDTTVYCSMDPEEYFEESEVLRSKGGREASIIQTGTMTILAITTVDVIQPSYEQSVDIYRWDEETGRFGAPFQVISGTHAENVLLISFIYFKSQETFLIVSEGILPRINNIPRLLIYRYDKYSGRFTQYQEIKDSGELQWTTLQSGAIIFVLDSRLGYINLYHYKGVSGFIKTDSIVTLGSKTLHVFKRRFEEVDNHYLVLSGMKSTLAPNVWDNAYETKVLKSKIKGGISKESYSNAHT